jgi:hypothetical protein
VIASSQTLIASSAEQLSFERIKARLEEVRRRLEERTVPKVVALAENDHVRTFVDKPTDSMEVR